MTPSRSKIWRRWSASVRSKRCCWTTSSDGSSGSTAPQRQRHRAKAALTHPIPCDLCSDGGRKIDVAEIDWPSTLRGEGAEVYARWERELRGGGFRLRAQIVEYLDGIPNNIALSLSWATPQSNEMKHGH